MNGVDVLRIPLLEICISMAGRPLLNVVFFKEEVGSSLVYMSEKSTEHGLGSARVDKIRGVLIRGVLIRGVLIRGVLIFTVHNQFYSTRCGNCVSI